MTEVTVPMIPRRLPPLPIFYGNAALSLLSVTWFPDDLDLARKCVARMYSIAARRKMRLPMAANSITNT